MAGRAGWPIVALLVVVGSALASGGGTTPGHSNDPPVYFTCALHHWDFELDSGDVSLELLTAGDEPFTEYEPGAEHALKVRVSSGEPERDGWGFQLVPLAGEDMAGHFTPGVDTWIRMLGDREYFTHVLAPKGAGPVTWEFTWTGPSDMFPPVVTFYACCNAANGDWMATGDYIECRTFDVTPVLVIRDSDSDGIFDHEELAGSYVDPPGTPIDPRDLDSDDDGIGDGDEVFVEGTDPGDCDTDSDGLPDGLEVGVQVPVMDPDDDGPLLGTDRRATCGDGSWTAFIADADSDSVTDPLDEDTDLDTCLDGEEDSSRDGAVGAGETNPQDGGNCPVITAARLQVLRLDAPLPDLAGVFGEPCTRLPDLRICDEAPGIHAPMLDDPSFPVSIEPADAGGSLVFVEYDSDLNLEGTEDGIRVQKDPGAAGALLISLGP